MPGLGTIVNVLAIIAGGLLGMTGGRFLTEKIQNTVITTAGICAMFLGTGSALARMLTLENGVLNTQGTMMMIGCLILGGLIGEVLGIEDRSSEKCWGSKTGWKASGSGLRKRQETAATTLLSMPL